MSGRLLVTGATGFVGAWVLRRWAAVHQDVEVLATSDLPSTDRIPIARYRSADLRTPDAARDLIRWARPDTVLHLAGMIGGNDLAALLAVNVLGTHNLYRALAAEGFASQTRVVQVSSAAVYGAVPVAAQPINEDQPLSPTTIYGVSKAAQEHVALAAAAQDGLAVIRARIFNLIGPGQPGQLVPMCFVSQISALGESEDRLEVGDVSPRRDFVDVRDAVEALDRLLASGEPGSAYNIASGRDLSIRKVIEDLIEVSGKAVSIEIDPSRLRKGDVSQVCADVRRIAGEVGWRAAIPVKESLRAMWSDPALSR